MGVFAVRGFLGQNVNLTSTGMPVCGNASTVSYCKYSYTNSWALWHVPLFSLPLAFVQENIHRRNVLKGGWKQGIRMADRDGGSIGVLTVEVSPWKLRWKRGRNDVELLRAGNDICKDSRENKTGWASALGFQLLLLILSCFLCLIFYMHLSAGEAFDSAVWNPISSVCSPDRRGTGSLKLVSMMMIVKESYKLGTERSGLCHWKPDI